MPIANTPTSPAIRFGVWALVGGTWASHHHPDEPVDASWRRNRAQILEAEALGYDTTLVAQHTIKPNGDHLGHLEAWTASAALAEATSRIEIITAIKPFLFHPVVLSKMALQIEEISQGRFAINLVNAWFKPELERAGIPFVPHDERYAYGREWLRVARQLMSGKRTTFSGRYFDVKDYMLRPSSAYRDHPTIYLGGESEAARALAADEADIWFINGQPPFEVARLIADVRARRTRPERIRFGLSAFVIARDTDEEARRAEAEAWEIRERDQAEQEALFAPGIVDTEAAMFQKSASYPAIGTNGGTAAGLVGSYDTVSARIREFHQLGIDTFMLQFQPFEAEMRRFAHHVIPRVRGNVEVAQVDQPALTPSIIENNHQSADPTFAGVDRASEGGTR